MVSAIHYKYPKIVKDVNTLNHICRLITCGVNNNIIEFTGDYWHCNPKLYESDWVHPIKNKTSEEIWDDDIRKNKSAESQGFNVIIVWEKDFLLNKQEVINECIEKCRR